MTEQAPEQIIIDTNLWVWGTRLLRTPLAVAFLHTVVKRKARILLPEVVRKEIHAVMQRECRQAASHITKATGDLRSLLGLQLPDIDLPDKEALNELIEERMAEFKTLLTIVPLTLRQSRSALERVYSKLPPSDREEQFRDAVVWEVVREAATIGPVYFVTQDTAFYKDRDYRKGLADSLAADVVAGSVKISQDLAAYLRECGDTPTLPSSKKVLASLARPVREHLLELDEEHTLDLDRLKSGTVDPFLTDRPNRVAYRFALTYSGRAWIDDESEPTECDTLVVGDALIGSNLKVIEVDLDYIRIGDHPTIPFRIEERNPTFSRFARVDIRVPPSGSRHGSA